MNNTMVVPENYIVQNQTNMPNVESNSNGNALNDMILPPPITSIQDMPSTSGSVNPNDLSNFFTPEVITIYISYYHILILNFFYA